MVWAQRLYFAFSSCYFLILFHVLLSLSKMLFCLTYHMLIHISVSSVSLVLPIHHVYFNNRLTVWLMSPSYKSCIVGQGSVVCIPPAGLVGKSCILSGLGLGYCCESTIDSYCYCYFRCFPWLLISPVYHVCPVWGPTLSLGISQTQHGLWDRGRVWFQASPLP